MKKLSLLLILIITITSMSSCIVTRNIIDGDKLTGADGLVENEDTIEIPETSLYGVQYIRTDGYNESFEYPRLIRITSRKALDFYVNNFDGIYSLGHRESVYSDSTIGFADAITEYDDGFFEYWDIYLAVLEEGSGSIRHSVAGITSATNVRIDSIVPECCTDDMAEWHIILWVGKGEVIDRINGKDVPVYTPEEIYEEFVNKLRSCAFEYLEAEYGITDATLGIVERTNYGRAVEEGFDNPLGYSPGYNESPAWRVECTTGDGRSFALYLCDSPFVFGTVGYVGEPVVHESMPQLNLTTLLDFVSRYGEDLSWDTFSPYYSVETGSGLYILYYPIDLNFCLLIGGSSPAGEPMYIRLVSELDLDKYVDLRYDDVNAFVEAAPRVEYFSMGEVAKRTKGLGADVGVKHDGFVNTAPLAIENARQAIERASGECTVSYDTATAYYDNNMRMWMVNFSTLGQLGGDQSVYMDECGVTELIVYGE